MLIATGRQMREIEADAVAAGTQVPELMERAGRAVAEEVARLAGGRPVTVLCGKGNNGGDGFVAARYLAQAGLPVTVFSLAPEAGFTGAALGAFQALHYGTSVTPIVLTDEKFGLLRKSLQVSGVAVDALLGIGLSGEVRGPAVRAIEMLNLLAPTVVSADVPSGLDADSGRSLGPAARADVTVTFTCQKLGLVLYPGAGLAGRVVVAPVGIDDKFVTAHTDVRLTQAEDAAQLLPQRPPDAHKGSMGKVLVVAGSTGMLGAAVLTSRSALRAGCGLVTLALPESLNGPAETKLTEELTLPLPEALGGRGFVVGEQALAPLAHFADGCDAVVIGPGLGREAGTGRLVRELLPQVGCPVVIDADGLYALGGPGKTAGGPSAERARRLAPTVLTPHHGEAAALLGATVEEVRDDLLAAAGELARVYRATVVLKGARTVITTGDRTSINPTGNPGLATAGTGDCLAGFIGGFMAQGLAAHEASVLATFLHGLAGDLAVAKRTVYCLVAGDLIDFLPEAVKSVQTGSRPAGLPA